MTKKRILSITAIIVFVAMLVTMWQLSISIKEDTSAAAQPFVKTDSIRIAHATDTHYYPLNYCFNGEVEGTAYESALITGTKLLVESSALNAAGFRAIAERDEIPDYLFVTGDLTLDGELQSHIEMANLLRELQNTIRENGNPDFQVLVSAGNHDLYNLDAGHYRSGAWQQNTRTTTRKDITKIYSSLGFPDLSDQEIEDYYATLPNVYFNHLPYEGNYVNSTTAANLSISYQYIENGKEAMADYTNGDMTYIVYAPDDYVFICIDDGLSSAELNHHVGGKIFDSTIAYLSDKSDDGLFTGKSLIGLLHHNTVPHFPLEGSLLKDFTTYGWYESSDFLADLGIRYTFTGHMHSNDIATRHSFNGNTITDTETASLVGYKGGVRYSEIARGTVGGKYAETYSSVIRLTEDADFSYLFANGFMSDYYLEYCNLDGFIRKNGSTYTCLDPSEYAVTKLFLNIVNNVKHEFLRPDFIANIGDMVADMLGGGSDNILIQGLVPFIRPVVNNLIAHLEDVVLKDYTYKGSNPEYKTNARGAKLCGYAEELVDSLLNLAVNSQGDTLFDFGIGAYLKHVGGLDVPESMVSDADREAFQNFRNGKVVRDMLDILLDKETGLYKLIIGLTQPLNLTKDMPADDANSLVAALRLLAKKGAVVDGSAIMLDDYASKVFGLLKLPLSMSGTLQEFLDHILESYITSSFYTSLGEIAHDILWQFSVDETGDKEHTFDGDYVLYIHDESLNVTYLSTAAKEAPSIENGKLPSMLTVTFGEEPTTQKNFVWFTDRRVEDTVIQYMEGEFIPGQAKSVTGTYDMYATTTASIDLGIFCTLMPIEIGRHIVTLRNLEPGTKYSYRVGSAAHGFWSDVYTFTTAPSENAPFELLLVTDLQGSSRTTYELAAEVMSKVETVFGENGYDFVINTGDLVDNSRNLVQWKYFLDIQKDFWRNTTQVVAAGNHDKYYYEKSEKPVYTLTVPNPVEDEYNYLLLHYNISYPEQNDKSGAYYSFDYSGVHFTVLNTNDLESNAMSAAQIEWLKADLEGTDKAHKIVIMHKGLYSTGAHSKDPDVVKMRAQLTPIFADYGVNLVLSGHDHTYSESYYLDGEGQPVKNSGASGSKIGKNGTLYITLGTLGDKFYKYVENDDVPDKYGKDLHNPTLANPTFGKLVFDGEDLYYYAYEYDFATGEIRELGKGLTTKDYIVIVSAAVVAALSLTVITVAIVKSRKKVK